MTRLTNIFLRLREQSQIWFSRFIILVLLGLIFFVAGGGVSHNKKWQIIQINVEGANAVSTDEVRAIALDKIIGNYFLVYARNNSHLFPVGEINQTLLHTFPRIASVSAVRDDEHTITINISERKPYALWCVEEPSSKDCWFIDEGGFVFDKAPEFSKGVYIEVYGKLVEKKAGEPLRASLPYDRFAIANGFTKLLRENIGKPFRIYIKSEDEIEVTIHTSAKHPFLADVVMRFKDTSDPANLVNNLEKAILTQFPNNIAPKKKLQYIDMRFGNKVIFGFEQ
ncbi:MAG: hypothetical protein UW27_C0003G0043 [Parcubacteria group bacterium GW2011_GWA1_44_13]|uniref:POTRA domain-containing protein n=1 Tax=Candidatus Nomurabacteria bacterium GW2011_GWB1_44_12 TaxID=1618748 RepID=A0A837I9P2_9BACT|nr:MAG: hypothetical protein UW17_C0028G0011 [Candidatus Nomurabacteria bacterium GW2011_GWD1_44_10]KKT36602.1 MAG: hypothetical protein UW25_C0005G0084 [Candidatus Nomurabacteria bacterium GW2011_GWB1_44_12]KKT38295.1 MAG: hypothetical protein UW27_C0003G0043 [Parcubacteria group bacterium GW2011_GWA1_44_13]HBB44215.1 hypothetical protein [Candidatus Yonathbacteria bacterium]